MLLLQLFKSLAQLLLPVDILMPVLLNNAQMERVLLRIIVVLLRLALLVLQPKIVPNAQLLTYVLLVNQAILIMPLLPHLLRNAPNLMLQNNIPPVSLLPQKGTLDVMSVMPLILDQSKRMPLLHPQQPQHLKL